MYDILYSKDIEIYPEATWNLANWALPLSSLQILREGEARV